MLQVWCIIGRSNLKRRFMEKKKIIESRDKIEAAEEGKKQAQGGHGQLKNTISTTQGEMCIQL